MPLVRSIVSLLFRPVFLWALRLCFPGKDSGRKPYNNTAMADDATKKHYRAISINARTG
jgi:hypothetical protein